MKRAMIAVLVLVILCSGCTGKKGGKSILPDIVDAYDISGEKKELVDALFSDLDDAFKKLAENDSLDDDDYYEYACEVQKLLDAFEDKFDWEPLTKKQNDATSDEEKNKWASIMLEHAGLLIASSDLSLEIFDKMMGGGSGERCLEAAINIVDSYAMLFYGESLITEDDLEKLGWD